MKHLYEKHNVLFAADVDDILKQLNQGLKKMHSKRMASFLVDVDAALREDDGPSVVFSTDAAPSEANVQNDRASQVDEETKHSDVGDIGGKDVSRMNVDAAKVVDVQGTAPKEFVYKKRNKVVAVRKGRKTDGKDVAAKEVTTKNIHTVVDAKKCVQINIWS